MPSSGYRKQTVDFGDMALDLQSAAASFTRMSAAAASFVSFVGAFKAFELQIVKVNSAVGGTAQTMKQLSDAARNFALVSKYSAGEAASSMVMLAQAGFSAQEAMSAMPSVLQLAQASMENLDLVADTVASTIRTYNLSATEASRVTNLFAASAVNSLATVNKLAFSFRQVGPVAAELGLSVEETAAALDILYNRGLRGEQAGTALRNILIRLIKPTKETYETFYRLGIALNNSNGQLRNYQDILKDLGTKKVSDTALTKMFGREALAGAKTLIAATTGEYKKMLETITDTDTAARMANAQMKTMDGSLKLIKNSLTELGIIVGESVGPLLKRVSDVIQNLAITLRTADKETIDSIKHFAQFAGTLYLIEKAATAAYSKLMPFVTTVNNLLNTKTLDKVATFFTNPNGKLTQQDFLRMWQIGQQGGKDWYTNMNEVYKSVYGKGLQLNYAKQIKDMTNAEAALLATTLKTTYGFKGLVMSLKAVGLAFAKLAPVMLLAWGAFKLYDSWAKEQERRAQLKEDLFPELTTLPEKLRDVKLALSRDIPDIVNAYEKAKEALTGAQRGVSNKKDFFANYGLGTQQVEDLRKQGMYPRDIVQKLYYDRVKAFENALKESFNKGESLSITEFYALGKDLGLESTLLDKFYDAYLEGLSERAELATRGIQARADTFNFKKIGETILEVMSAGAKDELKILEKAQTELRKVFTKDVTMSVFTIGGRNADFIKDIVKTQALNKDRLEEIGRAYAFVKFGVPIGEDPETYIRKNSEEAFKKWQEWNDLTEEQKAKLLEPVIKNLSTESQAAIKTNMEVEADAKISVTALDLHSQQLIVEQLKKQYADLLSDYKLSWEVLSQEQYAVEKIAKLQREIKINNDSLATTVDKVYQDIFKVLGRTEFDANAAKEALRNIDSETGKLINKEQLLASLGDNIDGTQREYVRLKLDELDLQTQIITKRNKELEQEEKQFNIVEGRLNRIKAYKEWLDSTISRRDSDATRDVTWENFKEGVHTGVYSIEKDIDTLYEMGREGMKGFADYMTDSMNNVVDAWGKGWDEMKSALKNTLADMLKDLAHYFMKQSMYMLASKVGGFFGAATTGSGYLGSFGNNQIYSSNFQGPLMPNQFRIVQKNGGVWDKGMQTFANGGVVTSPTLFNHRGGKGLMGEAGPEAIMPLRRDSQGRLGVSVAGGSTLNYAPSFNINMTTGQMDSETSQRNTNRMTKELDNKVKNAVLLVLAKEKRPGGLLYGR